MDTAVRHFFSRTALVLIACIALIAAALSPAFASRADALVGYQVWVEGTMITEDNADDVFGDGTVSYESTGLGKGTLTLHNAYLGVAPDPDGSYDAAAIYSNYDLTIVLEGKNMISNFGTVSEDYLNGIICYDSDLTITGDGSLNMNLVGESIPNGCSLYGIYVDGGKLTIDSTTLDMYIGSGSDAPQFSACGIMADETSSIANSVVSISCYGAYSSALGMRLYNNLAISGDSKVSIACSLRTNSYSNGIAEGIDADGILTVADSSNVRSDAWNAKMANKGIVAYGGLTVSGKALVQSEGETYGVESPDIIVRDNAILRAGSYEEAALSTVPNIANHSVGGAYASETNRTFEDYWIPPVWDGTTPLGGYDSPYHVVWIPGAPMIKRIAGDYANETAAKISQEFLFSSGSVVLARDDDFADALGATGLAGVFDAPIILTDRTTLSPAAADEINRLGALDVYIIGGPGAMKEQLETDLKEQCGIDPEDIHRIYGENSYDTSLACAKEIENAMGGNVNEVYVAMSLNFQDALSISPWAYYDYVPIVLQTWGATSDERGFTDEARAFLEGKKVTVIGGPGAISEASLAGLNVVDRIYGEDGYGTSNAIAEKFWEDDGPLQSVVFACGAQAPKGTDALAGSALASWQYGPILLVNGNEAMEAENLTTVNGFFKNHKDSIREIHVLGGNYVVPPATYNQISALVNANDITP